MSAAVVWRRLARTPAWLVDALVAALVAGWIVYRMAAGSGPPAAAPDALGYGLALSMAAVLLVRRRWPLAVLLWMVPAWFVYHVNGYLDGAPGPAMWVALYSGAAAERRRGVFLAAAALLVLDAGGRMAADRTSLLDTAMDSSTVIFVAALLLGDTVRSRRRWLRQAVAEREREAERRVAEEPADLRQAVRVVAAGEALLSPSVTRRLIAAFVAQPGRRPADAGRLTLLTDREREVVALVAEGLSNQEIAGRLYMSPATARTHVHRAMAKLDTRDRAQLVVLAYQTGLVGQGQG